MKQTLAVFALTLVTSCFLTASTQAQSGLKALEGTINIDGSSTVAPITIEADAGFRKIAPKVKVPVGVSGTGGGFKRFTKGETDISDASRPVSYTHLTLPTILLV